MTSFNIENTNPATWQETDEMIEILISKINKYFEDKNESITVVSPLLRSGGIVGSILAIKMKILTMLPVQFKYFYNPTRIGQILSIPDILGDMPQRLNILLCEGNTSSGSIAMKAIEKIKEKYPNAKIYLATLTKVYGCPERLEGIEEVFYGKMSNENSLANKELEEKLGLRKGITIFPWESIEDELSDLNNTKF